MCSCRYPGPVAIGPHGAVLKVLLLPDGDGALEGVDCEAACLESGGTGRGADGDENAGFADLQATETVGGGDAVDRKFLVNFVADFADLCEGHGFVGFVFK